MERLKNIPKWVFILVGILILVIGYKSCSRVTIISRCGFRVARNQALFPDNIYGKQRNFILFTNELFAAIGRDQNCQFEWVPATIDNLMKGLNDGQWEGVLTLMVPDARWYDTYIFSKSYYYLGPVLVVPISSSVQSMKEIQGKRVGILRQSPALFTLPRFVPIDILQYLSPILALQALERGEIDAIVLDQLFANALIEGIYKGRLRVIPLSIGLDGIRLVAAKGSQGKTLIETFDKGLKNLRDNGTYHKLLEKWDLPETY